jgi:hypothetical protein
MAHRNIQVKFRLRPDILRKLERDAKRQKRSVNDEIGRRLERYDDLLERYEELREQRLILMTYLRSQLEQTPEGRAVLERLEKAEENDFQKQDFPDIMKGGQS